MEKKKQKREARISVDVPEDVHYALKLTAVQRRTSLRQLIIQYARQLAKGGVAVLADKPIAAEEPLQSEQKEEVS